MTQQNLPQWVYGAALAGLPMHTPRRLRQLIDHGDPFDTWHRIIRGEDLLPQLPEAVKHAWAQTTSENAIAVYKACREQNIEVTIRGMANYPAVLNGDPYAPAVIFYRGDLCLLEHRRVGIIGTRHPTRTGARMAFRLGAQLAEQQVAVVSGLARGIDVEAHAGVMSRDNLATPPIGVVASGIDVVYPPEHHKIWNQISTHGLLISEAPPKTQPAPHRFPLRNRIIAALSEVLVVVESGHKGGSMITVREAMKRDVTVMAVPGSADVRQSEGTTALLRDGCAPVGDVTDVLVALGLDTRRRDQWCETRQGPTSDELSLLTTIGRTPRSIDEIILLTGMSVVDVAVTLGRLEAKQWVSHSDGWWEALLD